tara:strand:+ start:706 stop:1149 length:444 start_codon:yes stop_codon:yes gene_type:complete
MGQYFIAVNEDKKEFIHPHRFGDGLKFFEIVANGCGFMGALGYLLRRSNEGFEDISIVGSWAGDRVSIVGDYDESRLYTRAQHEEHWKDVGWEVLEAMVLDGYLRSALDEGTAWRRSALALKGNPEEVAKYNSLFKPEGWIGDTNQN